MIKKRSLPIWEGFFVPGEFPAEYADKETYWPYLRNLREK